MISRICEEFHIPPSVAVQEPLFLCSRVIELRAYAAAKHAVENAAKADDLPDDPMVEMVQTIQFEIARERIDARRKGKD